MENAVLLGAYRVEILPLIKMGRVIAYTERGSREFMRLSPSYYLSLLQEVEDYMEKGIKEIEVRGRSLRFFLSFFPSDEGDKVIISFPK